MNFLTFYRESCESTTCYGVFGLLLFGPERPKYQFTMLLPVIPRNRNLT